MTLLIYTAARFSRRYELSMRAGELLNDGHIVTSRWLYHHEWDGGDDDLPPALSEAFAEEDLEDIASSDVFVIFTDPPEKRTTRGGRHVESGYALALGLPVVVVGPRENVFHHLSRVTQFDSWADARAWLKNFCPKTGGQTLVTNHLAGDTMGGEASDVATADAAPNHSLRRK